MDRSAVKAIVEREIEPLMRRLGLPHWRIVVRYESADTGRPTPAGWVTRGSCETITRYERATITLDPEAFDDEGEVLECLTHELLHIVLSPFDLYRQFASALIRQGSSQDVQEDHQWTHAIELGVRNLERMVFGLGAGVVPPVPKPDPVE